MPVAIFATLYSTRAPRELARAAHKPTTAFARARRSIANAHVGTFRHGVGFIHCCGVIRPGGTVWTEPKRTIGPSMGVFTHARVVSCADPVLGTTVGARGLRGQGEEQAQQKE